MKVAKILFPKPNDFQSIHPDSTGDGNTWTAKSDQNDGAHSLQDLNVIFYQNMPNLHNR
jgi:hypothetical protein